jgi:hypothetical protein
MSTQVFISDAVVHTPIPLAQVFVNGTGIGTTDSNGLIVVDLGTNLTVVVTVRMDGYLTLSTTINSEQIKYLYLQPNTSTAALVDVSITVIPEDIATGATFTISNNNDPISVQYSPGNTKFTGVVQGIQVITGVVDGYSPVNQSVDISPINLSQTITLTKTTDDGLATAAQTAITQDPDVNNILPVLSTEDLPEFIAPNTGQGTYFTMTQARMYIGKLFIDELSNLQFALQDNQIPIYGYASRFYDAVAQGKSLVQGQFTINFISEGYLVMALRKYASTIDSDTTAINSVVQQQQARLLTLTNQLSNPNGKDPNWTPAMIKAAKAEINKLAAALGPAALANAKAGIAANVRLQNDSILGLPGGDYTNAIYEDTPFDIIIQYSGAGRVITRRLEDCHLISNESIMDHSGVSILDSYGFIARRLR